ncbi:MAG: hypothetical protein LBJ31_09310 [Treponema sp.]|jgi:hypothetical protein|nr:hypothetical protein [Treponema sp.]
MSDSQNPYASPQSEASAVAGSGRVLTEKMVSYLKAAAPWARFIGIVGFVFCGILGLLAIVISVAGVQVPGLLGVVGSAVSFFYLLGVAAIMFFPSLFAFRFGRRVQNFLRTDDSTELEEALRNDKSRYKFYGILYIIMLGFTALGLILGIIGGIITAFAIG